MCSGVKMTNNFIDINRSDGVTVITLSDPQTRNALSPEMALELYDAFEIFESSSDEKVLILTGLDPSFCSGANKPPNADLTSSTAS